MNFLGSTFVEAAPKVYVSLDGKSTLCLPGWFWLELKLVLDELNPVKGN